MPSWLFHRFSTAFPQADGDRLLLRVQELEHSVKELESQARLLKNEWLDFYDKLSHIADRLRKRTKIEEVENVPEVVDQPAKPLTHYQLFRKMRTNEPSR